MICLGYFSSAPESLSSQELGVILEQSRRNNQARGVTGLLCHYDGSFLQFLEGPEEVVLPAYERIAQDPRHTGLIEICRQPIEARAFADWSMGVVDVARMGPAEQAFCKSLRDIQITAPAAHREAIEPFLDAFRSWMPE